MAHLDPAREELLQMLSVLGDEPRAVIVVVDNRAADLAAFFAVWIAGHVAVPISARSLGQGEDLIARTDASAIINVGVDPVVEFRPRKGAKTYSSDDALILMTSGTTGRPKLLVQTHERLCAKFDAICEALPMAGGITVLPLHLNFSFGQWVSWVTLREGGELRLVRRFDPKALLDQLADDCHSRVAVVPTMIRMMLPVLEQMPRHPLRSREADLLFITGGEVLDRDTGEHLRRVLPCASVADVYGLSETATSDFILPPSRYDANAGTVGWPTRNVRFRLVDVDSGKPADRFGELQIASPFTIEGYLDDPKATVDAFQDGFFRTGDLARLTDDGALAIVGRIKQVVNRAGIKVSPDAVEAAVTAHPAVLQCAAVSGKDAIRGERVVVAVVLQSATDRRAVATWSTTLASDVRPDEIVAIEEIPIGATGKTDRDSLARLLGIPPA